jgi:ATP-dependent Clp protease adaptor protein ClpS
VSLGCRCLIERGGEGGPERIDLGTQHRSLSDRRPHGAPLLADLLEQPLDMRPGIGRPRSARRERAGAQAVLGFFETNPESAAATNRRGPAPAPNPRPLPVESEEMAQEPDKKTGGAVLEQTRRKTQQPRLYRVLLHNDDYTTMEFVVHVLETIFDKGPAEAHLIMMHVHVRGQGVCGRYTYEVAETKVTAVHRLARDNGFPLRASLEEE